MRLLRLPEIEQDRLSYRLPRSPARHGSEPFTIMTGNPWKLAAFMYCNNNIEHHDD